MPRSALAAVDPRFALSGGTRFMQYRAYLINGDGRITDVEIIAAPTDEAAVERGRELLRTYPIHDSVEVWDRARMVARVVGHSDLAERQKDAT